MPSSSTSGMYKERLDFMSDLNIVSDLGMLEGAVTCLCKVLYALCELPVHTLVRVDNMLRNL